LLVEGLKELLQALIAANVHVLEDGSLPGYLRAFVSDPFGNRIELIEPQ
jgi:hypothetical protein